MQIDDWLLILILRFHAISDLSRRLEKLEDVASDMFDVLERLNASYPPKLEDSHAAAPSRQATIQHKGISRCPQLHSLQKVFVNLSPGMPPHTGSGEHQSFCSHEDLSLVCNFTADEQLQYFRARIGEQHGLGSRFGPLYPIENTFSTTFHMRKDEVEYPEFSSPHSSTTDTTTTTTTFGVSTHQLEDGQIPQHATLAPAPLASALPSATQRPLPSSAHGSVDEFGQTLSGGYYIPAGFCLNVPDSR
jgi:hypothetical protein